MSFYSDASLVLIPSGYKDQKVYSAVPTDGSGDLVFSRASGATRVASNGLIEKVRTNLALYSEAFDNAWWSKSSITITANDTTDPFGGTAADKVLCSAGTTSPNTFSTGVACTSGVEYTASYYAKQGTSKYAKIRFSSTAFASATNSPIFDLNAGTVVSGTGTITSVGNGWYRISATQVAEASANGVFTVDIPSSTGVWPNGTFAGTEYIYIFGYQFETGVMTDYIATTSAAVSVGPVSGLPRLDYLGSTCPRLLLEPQRTNLATYSEQADVYTKVGATIGSNVATSPDGYTNADSLIEDGSTGGHAFFNFGITTFSAVPYTASVFAKKGGRDWFVLSLYDGTQGFNASYNLNTGVLGTIAAGATATITNYGNGWYRCTITATAAAGSTGGIAIYAANANNSVSYAGTNGLAAGYFYGWQLEAAAYATSYIPTLGSSVTRVAEVASKTGITSLIGQTEGTLFVDFDFNGNYDANGIVAMDVLGAGSNEAYIFVTGGGQLRLELYVGGAIQALITTSIGAVGRKKIAFGYKQNDFVGYMNGVQVGTDISGTVGSMNTIYIGTYQSPTYATGNINQALVFKTRLSNTALAELTA